MPRDLPKMPGGLEDLLRGLSKAVLKEKPENILDFSAKYFENLLIERDGSLMKNYERFEHYEKSISKLVKQTKIGGESGKKYVKSSGKNKKNSVNIVNPKVVIPTVQNTKLNDETAQKKEKIPSPLFGDKVVEKEPARKIMETAPPRGKLKVRTRSSISLNAITEESTVEIKEERRLMYRNAVKKIQRAFRQYIANKNLKSIPDTSSKSGEMDEDRAARIIQNVFKTKFPKKSTPQLRPRSIKNKNLERVPEGGEDSKSLLEYLQEEENAKKTQPNIEHDSDTGETTRVEGVKISNADSLENMIINDDVNREQNSTNNNENGNKEEQAAIKIQSTFRGHQTRKEMKQQRELNNVTTIPATVDEDIVVHKKDGEMELAAVKIQKNYRGYKVRKDILSTKNLVNSGNLVAAAGNIIGSIANNFNQSELHSNNEADDVHTQLNISPEEVANNENILSEANEIHGTVTESPEFLNNENSSEEIETSADVGNAKMDDIIESKIPDVKSTIVSDSTDLVCSTEHEVSHNISQDIEHVIGINEQESKLTTNNVKVTETSQMSEGDSNISAIPAAHVEQVSENETPIIHNKLELTSSTSEQERSISDNKTLEDSKLGEFQSTATEIPQTTIILDGGIAPKHHIIDAINDSVESHPSLSSDAITVQDHSVVKSKSDTLSETLNNENVSSTIETKTETQPPSTELEAYTTVDPSLSENSAIHSSETEVLNESDHCLPNSNDSAASDKTEIPQKKHIIPEVTVDGASEEIVSDSEDDNFIDLKIPNMNEAALKIQKTFRGHQVRKDIKEKKANLVKLSETTMSSMTPAENVFNQTVPSQTVEIKEVLNTVKNQKDLAAIKIQKTYRGHQVRKELKQKNAENSNLNTVNGVSVVQNNVEHPMKILEQETIQKQDSLPDLNDPEIVEAALKIQKALMSVSLKRKTNKQEELKEKSENVMKNSQNPEEIDATPIENIVALSTHIDSNLEIEKEKPDEITKDDVVVSNLSPKEKEHDPQLNNNMVNGEKKPEIILKDNEAHTESTNQIENIVEHDFNLKNKDQELLLTSAEVDGKLPTIQINELEESELHPKTEESIHTLAELPNQEPNNHNSLSMVDPKLDEQPLEKPTPTNQDEIKVEISTMEHQESLPDLNDPEMEVAAHTIQKSFRNHQARKRSNQSTVNEPEGAVTNDSANKIETEIKPVNVPDLNNVALKDQDVALILPPSSEGDEKQPTIQINKVEEPEPYSKKEEPIHLLPNITVDEDKKPEIVSKEDDAANEAPILMNTVKGTEFDSKSEGPVTVEIDKPEFSSTENVARTDSPLQIDHVLDSTFNSNSDNQVVLLPSSIVGVEKEPQTESNEDEGSKEPSIQTVNIVEQEQNSMEEDSLPHLPNVTEYKEDKQKIASNGDTTQMELSHETDNREGLETISKKEGSIEIQSSTALDEEITPEITPNKDVAHREPKLLMNKEEESELNSITEAEGTSINNSSVDTVDSEKIDAAVKIQKSYRGHKVRKEYKQRKEELQQQKLSDIDVKPDEVSKTMLSKDDSTNIINSERENIVMIDNESPQHDTAVANSNELTNSHVTPQQQESLPDLNDPEMQDAALKIQKSFRGHQVRKNESNKRAKRSIDPEEEHPADNSMESLPIVNDKIESENNTADSGLNLLNESPDLTDSNIDLTSNENQLEHQDSLPDLNDPEMADAAIKIQKSFRVHQSRKEAKLNEQIKQIKQITLATENQMTDPVKIAPDITINENEESLPDLNDPEMADAALKIQKSFRGHQARKDQSKRENLITLTTESAANTSITQDINMSEINSLSKLPSTGTNGTNNEELVEHNKEMGHRNSLPDLNDPEMAKSTTNLEELTNQELNSHNNSINLVDNKLEEQTLEKPTSISNPEEMKVEMSAMEHQESLPDLNDPEMEVAAHTIQKSFRNHQARKLTAQSKVNEQQDIVTNDSTTKVETETNPQIENQDSLPDLNDPEMADAALKIQKSFRGHRSRKDAAIVTPVTDSNLLDTTQNETGVIIDQDSRANDSSLMENHDTLSELKDTKMADAALKIQKTYRGHKVRKELKEAKGNITIDKILSGATAPPADEIIGANESSLEITKSDSNIIDEDPKKVPSESTSITDSNILSNLAPDIIAKAAETAAINIQRTYRGYRTRRDLQSHNISQLVADAFEDENKLVDSLDPILDQKPEDKIDADSLDNFNVEERTEVVEEPCQKIVYKSKLSMLIENSKSGTQSSSSDKIETKPNDDYFDSLENTQTSEMDESAQTVLEVQHPSSIVDTSHDTNTYDSSIFGLKIESEPEQYDVSVDDSISRKTTAEVTVPDTIAATRGGMTDEEIKEIQNIDLASFEKDSLEAMYYSLRKNELLLDQMHSLSNVEQISDQTEPPRQFTAKQKLMSMGESDSDDIVFKQLSIDYDEYSEISNQHTARSTTDDDADVEVVRDVLYYNDGKQVLPDQSEVKREPGDGASVASDNLLDNHSNVDDQEIRTKHNAHHFEIFSLDEEIKNLESNIAPYQHDNPLFYAQQKIEKFLHQIHGNRNETEDDADNENDDDFLDNPIDSNKSYLSEKNFNLEEDEGEDVVDELRSDLKPTSARKVLSSVVSEADSDYIEPSRAKPIKDDFNISTALDNYLSTDSDSTYNSAATKIQAGARGFLTRRRIQSLNRQSISERRSSIGNAAIDQSLDDMIEENEERKKFKFHEAQSTFREDTLTSSGEMEVYGITDIKVKEKKVASPITDSGNESTTSIDTETQTHLRNKYERLENESSFDAIDEDNLSDVVDVIRTSNVQNKLRSPIKNKTLSNINFDEYDRVATRRMTLQRGIAVQGNSTPSDEDTKSPTSISGIVTTNSEDKNDEDNVKKTSYDSPIRRKSTDSASLMTKSSNSLPDLQKSPKRRGFIQRQRTMPVQIETEIIRPLPKHMRKRIKSANSSAHSSHHASNLYKKKSTY